MISDHYKASEKPKWEEEFDKKFEDAVNSDFKESSNATNKKYHQGFIAKTDYWMESATVDDVKSFISQLLLDERKENEKLKDALIWCSGSADFQLEGQAREGWEKICMPLLNQINKK